MKPQKIVDFALRGLAVAISLSVLITAVITVATTLIGVNGYLTFVSFVAIVGTGIILAFKIVTAVRNPDPTNQPNNNGPKVLHIIDLVFSILLALNFLAGGIADAYYTGILVSVQNADPEVYLPVPGSLVAATVFCFFAVMDFIAIGVFAVLNLYTANVQYDAI